MDGRVTSSYPAIGQKFPGTSCQESLADGGTLAVQLAGILEDDMLPYCLSIMIILSRPKRLPTSHSCFFFI